MNRLFFGWMEDLTDDELADYLIKEWEADPGEVRQFQFLIAYEGYECYEASAYFLMRHKETAELFETYGSHCSCYGYEGQFSAEPTTIEYLMSDKFEFSTIEWGDEKNEIMARAKEFIATLPENDRIQTSKT